MAWKDWSYWLRGGIIGVIISLIVVTFFNSKLVFFNEGLSMVLMVIFLFPMLILPIIFPEKVADLFFNMGQCFIACPMRSSGYILLLFIYFILGALIGWIVGKIKNKNEEKK